MLKAVACVHPKYLIGARAGKSTRFVVLDIDKGSRYHTKHHLDQLITVIMNSGLNEPVLYRSSHSDGWHLYIFFDEPVPAKEVHRLICDLLRSDGWLINKGTLEVFPNPGEGSMGMGLRLPLQPGFAWLNCNTLDVEAEREWLTPQQAIDRYMEDCRQFGNDIAAYRQLKKTVAERQAAGAAIAERLDRAIGGSKRHIEAANELAATAVARVFRTPPPGIDPDVWWRGRTYFETGLTGPSQRADAIFSLGHYLFYGDPERGLEALGYNYEGERRLAIERILALKNHGQSKDISRGRADAMAQISRAANWRPVHKRGVEIVPYKRQVPIAWVRHNGNLKADAITRIKNALKVFVEASEVFTAEELARRAECSKSTLYKHKQLWKSLQQELYRNRLTVRSDEYNAVEGAGCSQTGAPAKEILPNMPPGRLAARRIAFELARSLKQNDQEQSKDMQSLSNRYTQSWKEEFARNLPATAADGRELKAALPILLALVCRAPDYEHQIWLQKELQIIREKLQAMRESFAGSGTAQIEPSD
jgi:hypothetical protein